MVVMYKSYVKSMSPH